MPLARNSARSAGRGPMKKAWRTMRTVVLWIVSAIPFVGVTYFLFLLGFFKDTRRNDWPSRAFFRNILRLAGAKFEVRRSPGFDPSKTSIFICNHVNIF